MACQLYSSCSSCPNACTVTTQCGHVFHTDCLKMAWSQNCHVCLPCPVCSTELGCVHQDLSGQFFIGIDAGKQWIAFYTIVNNKTEPIYQSFSWWKRHSARLEKHESINIRSHIVVA